MIIARDNQPTVMALRKNFNLSKSEIIKILVYSANQQNTDDIKKMLLRFGNLADTAYFEYDIRNLKPGWNVVEMPKSNFSLVTESAPSKSEEGATDTNSERNDVGNERLWSSIEKVVLELDARPNSQVELTIDRLWAEKDEAYKKEFFTSNFDLLSPRTWQGKSYINVWAMGTTLGLINKITGVKNFIYTAKVIPQKAGSFGINARTDITTTNGYYLDIGRVGTGSWKLYKYGKPGDAGPITQLDSGGFANFQLEINQPVWLRLAMSGNKITGFISTDGNNFTKLTEVNDGELASGGIGIHTANASFLLESVEFSQ